MQPVFFNRFLILTLLSLFVTLCAGCATSYVQNPNTQTFVQRMADKHQFDPQQLDQWFAQTKPDNRIIKLMTTPHEASPWYAYSKIFLTPQRVAQGAQFWQQHAVTLAYAEKQYGVPAAIIVAILGVETNYGTKQGNFHAFDALSTLAFSYPPRAPYFQSELEQYLLLTRDMHFDPLTLKSSYAGALGQPQFMPSSYRKYAVSYANNSRSDLFNNADDTIVSVANYFQKHGWQAHEPIAEPARVKGRKYLSIAPAPQKLSKPHLNVAQLAHEGARPAYKHYPPHLTATLFSVTTRRGNEYWLGFNNFYVITKYNTSVNYAMAVYQLSTLIYQRHQQLTA